MRELGKLCWAASKRPDRMSAAINVPVVVQWHAENLLVRLNRHRNRANSIHEANRWDQRCKRVKAILLALVLAK